jgi:hypothetical protein
MDFYMENRAHYVYFGLLFCRCLSTTKVKIALLLQVAKRKVVLRFLVNDFIFFMDSKCCISAEKMHVTPLLHTD